ncbi:type I glyceraldehyde-3-phosphate dehydrogenase [Candidatus Woesearchaeota archaeon]|nr:type I glyceraldehyde-3-phosphate dehydrogenase [Candidatus Woesearchaeota archaeon]
MNIAINGFGRIGRVILRILCERGIKVTAINDLGGVETAAYLLKHDTAYGNFNGKAEIKEGDLVVNGKRIKFFSQKDPLQLPWKQMKIDVVIEAAGVFNEGNLASQHLIAGAKKVIITAPAKGADATIVPGVNHSILNKSHNIVSVSSCTTNCLAPIVKILNNYFGVEKALMTTIHAYTNDQAIQDTAHKKLRRGRAGAANLIPTTTGAAHSVEEVIPEMKGRVTGLAVRAPVICGSLIDLTAELRRPFTTEEINAVFELEARKGMKGIIEYSGDELVSSDVIENTHSAVFDSKLTQKSGNLVKIFAWYDNEYGYSQRVADVVVMMEKFV